MVEKPFALNLKDADEMMEALQKAGVSCMVRIVLKFDTGYAMVENRIDNNELGKIEAMYLFDVRLLQIQHRPRYGYGHRNPV